MPGSRTRAPRRRHRERQRGLSLIELMVAVAIIGVLGAVVGLSVVGFSARARSRAYEGDQRALTSAVQAWRTDIARQSGTAYPILQGGTSCLGTVDPANGALTTPGCNPYLDIAALATQRYLPGSGDVASANTLLNTTATNQVNGHYGWYVASLGRVTSYPLYQEGLYP